MLKTRGHAWRFKARLRRHAFGWKSQPAIARLQEAVSEIRQVARIEPILAAEGAVALQERISPALETVDSSSGDIGTAVNNTIAELVPILVAAPADATSRAAWLEPLFEAHGADQIPYIQRVPENRPSFIGPSFPGRGKPAPPRNRRQKTSRRRNAGVVDQNRITWWIGLPIAEF